MSADPVILKILGGMQAGVEVPLADGTYFIGSGPDDDIQLVDISLIPGHARLRIGSGKVEIAALASTVQLGSGETLTADQGWRALEPLDAVTAGTTRFALGAQTANWASVAEDGQRRAAPAEGVQDLGQGALPAPHSRLRVLALPLLALLAVALFGGWYALTGGRLPSAAANRAQDLHSVRAALDAFPFGVPIETRQEVDGALYVKGYVQTPVERRALVDALDRTGVPMHLRLFVRDDMRGEIVALIAAEKLAITFTLSDKGEVAIEGLVLQSGRERKLVAELRDTVLGVSEVVSHVQTADTLLEGVRELVAASQLKPWLLLRLDGDLIEVSGALPSDKVDAWVGFLQTYATRFANEIPLRSFVQLQMPNGSLAPAPGTTAALAVGARSTGSGDMAVDIERLRRGDFALGDVFVGAQNSRIQRDRAPTAPGPTARANLVAEAAPREVKAGSGGPSALRDPAGSGAGLSDGGATPSSPVTEPGSSVVLSDPAHGTAGRRRPADVAADDAASRPRMATVGRAGAELSAAQDRGPVDPRARPTVNDGGRGRAVTAETADTGHSGPALEEGRSGLPATGPVMRGPGQGQDGLAFGSSDVKTRIDAVGVGSNAAALAQKGLVRTDPEQLTAQGPVGGEPAVDALSDRAARALERLRDAKAGGDDSDQAIDRAVALLDSPQNGAALSTAGGARVADWYLPLFVDPRAPRPGATPCWDGTALTADDILPVLFWLDVLSVSRLVTMTGFDPAQQALLIEAALDPRELRACSQRKPAAAEAADHSLYLREVSRNQGFVGFVLRDLPATALDIAGASLGRHRFVLTRAGERLAEGAAPDRGSRLAVVGELGLALQQQDGLSVLVYGPDICWVVAN